MSFTVDDLTSSLSSSHIGQEAMDLAALQAQLTATLFAAAATRSSRPTSHQHLNTPLARTPSNSISMSFDSVAIAMRKTGSRRGSYSTPHHNYPAGPPPPPPPMSPTAFYHHHSHYHHTSPFDDMMEEDERMMVEELLLPPPSSYNFNNYNLASPITPASPPSWFDGPNNNNNISTATTATPTAFLPQPPPPSSSSSSMFTTCDPFYLSQVQASQQPFVQGPTAAQSVFAQNGRMPQGSMFALKAAF